MDEPHIVSDNQDSVLSQLDSDVYNALLDSVKEKEKQSAFDKGILDQAKDNAMSYIQDLFANNGHLIGYTVEFR